MPLRTLKVIEENFRFLISEVGKQVSDSLALLEDPENNSVSRLESRDNYIDILKGIIESKCFKRIRESPNIDKKTLDIIRAINAVTANLERIGDFAVNIGRQTRYLEDPYFFKQFEVKGFYKEIQLGLKLIDPALFTLDTSKALRICRRELRIDDLYNDVFVQIMNELRAGAGDRVQNLVTSLFVFRYLERAGDSLLNIGEAIISAVMGERLKIHQFRALEESLAESGSPSHANEISYRTLAETRSGSRIGLVEDHKNGEGRREVVFKNGDKRKIREEKERIEKWESLVPGLPPKIFGYQMHKRDSSLLLEALSGRTLQEIILNDDRKMLKKAKQALFEILSHSWTTTKKKRSVKPHFISQLKDRLEHVYKVHPEFNEDHTKIGLLEIRSFNRLTKQAEALDSDLKAPFSVFIHGDFNADNILYNFENSCINFIDLHRSRQMDFVQDVTVHLISNFRLPVYDSEIRDQINKYILDFYAFAWDFAKQNDDKTFTLRCALGLTRSFITSTRFELNKKFARAMYHRGIYLLERVVNTDPDSYEKFVIPEDILVY